MPYINITETDINPMASFDTIENAVLIFGYDFSNNFNATDEYKEERKNELLIKPYTLYTSLISFISDLNKSGIIIDEAMRRTPAFRPYVTAYDCLAMGLPVIFMPMDGDCSEGVIHRPEVKGQDAVYSYTYEKWISSEGSESAHWSDPISVPAGDEGRVTQNADGEWYYTDSESNVYPAEQEEVSPAVEPQPEKDFIVYEWLSNGDAVVQPTSEGYDDTVWSKTYKMKYEDAVKAYDKLKENDFAEKTLGLLLERLIKQNQYLLSDRVNLPFTFITTCGYERSINGGAWTRISSLTGASNTKPLRRDFIYLYDLEESLTPDDIIKTSSIAISDPKTLVNIVYPWGHYNSYTETPSVHMPGSYAYLMAYANSIKNNKPWLAIAGINRGVIPNIVSTDFDIQEAYLHAFQGDDADLIGSITGYRINPIINLGQNYGKIIFGNRTCDTVSEKEINFGSFLNIRLLLTYIHKQAFISSMSHMFEPNDDIVWLSFKQKVNDLLDQMITGRGIKWYKWYKLQSDKLGQIKAKLVIRPIEAVESFDINITMTDAEIEVAE